MFKKVFYSVKTTELDPLMDTSNDSSGFYGSNGSGSSSSETREKTKAKNENVNDSGTGGTDCSISVNVEINDLLGNGSFAEESNESDSEATVSRSEDLLIPRSSEK